MKTGRHAKPVGTVRPADRLIDGPTEVVNVVNQHCTRCAYCHKPIRWSRGYERWTGYAGDGGEDTIFCTIRGRFLGVFRQRHQVSTDRDLVFILLVAAILIAALACGIFGYAYLGEGCGSAQACTP